MAVYSRSSTAFSAAPSPFIWVVLTVWVGGSLSSEPPQEAIAAAVAAPAPAAASARKARRGRRRRARGGGARRERPQLALRLPAGFEEHARRVEARRGRGPPRCDLP